MRKHSVLAIALVIAAVLGCANSAFAQAGAATAQLNGTVTDASGGSVAGATISVRNTATNTTSTTTSNERGSYTVANLPPGNYELNVVYTGFGNYKQTGIVLTVGQSATINPTLQVAAQGEKVVVTSEAPVIEPTKTEISQVVESQQIQSLPISGRLFTDFALLTPGVATSRTSLGTTITEFEVTQISFGGMRSFSNEITVDGADFVNTVTGVQRATPPQDAVQEFRVVNNSFGAEYGRAIGGIVNIVTKSGTNDLHGSVYDYFQNNVTNSRSSLQKAPLQPFLLPNELRHNQFGATLGGPLVKDKTFFFINYEGKRRAETPNFSPNFVNNLENIDIARGFMGLSPENTSVLKTADNDYGFARLDHQISASNRLALRYVVEDARDLNELVGQTLDGGGIGSPSGGRNLFIRDQSVVGTLSSIVTPNLVNTALVQYARRHYNFPGVTGEPDLLVENDLDFGHNFGIYDRVYETRLQGADSVSWVKGNHLAKFGFDGNYVWSATNFPGFTPANIRFPSLDCMFAFANFVNFMNGNPGSIGDAGGCPPSYMATQGVDITFWGTLLPRSNCADINGGSCGGGFFNGILPDSGYPPNAFVPAQFEHSAYYLNHGYWGLYAQDQWRVTPKLTFNYGLRWDYESGLGIQIDPFYHAFQPKVGLAYAPDSKTVIRAGYGLFFDRNNMSFFMIPGGQKTMPGFMCNTNGPGVKGPAVLDPSCATALGDAGGDPANAVAIQMPMVRTGADTAGWQVGAIPGSAASIPCALPPDAVIRPQGTTPPCPAGSTSIAIAALIGLEVLDGNPHPYPPSVLTGTCIDGGGACGVGAGGIDRHNGKLPYAHQASLQIDRQFGGGFALELGYLFVGAHRLVRGNNLNVQCPSGTSKPGNPLAAQGLLNPNGTLSPCDGTPILGPLGIGPIFNPLFNPALPTIFNPTGLEFVGYPFNPGGLSAGLLDYNNDVANANYHGLALTATEKWGKYLNLTANYTYSHTIDNGNFTTFINLPPNQFDYAPERGNSNQDVRHHLVTNFTLAAPKDSFLRNFEFSSIITLQSGRPFTIYAGENILGDQGGGTTDRTGGLDQTGLPGTNCPSVGHCRTLISRNTYVGKPLYSWDFRLSRAIHLTESLKLDLMVDAFNALNRANVDEVSYIYGPVFCGDPPAIPRHFNDATTRAIQNGLVSCATQQAAGNPGAWLDLGMIPLNIDIAPNKNFGKPRTMFNPRQFQFAAKFSF
ncbi:MAG: TonB-dependent receptor [Acidobacteriia bacterium]|nr:TonB-dependent receptor [Terriglobia bacterium]